MRRSCITAWPTRFVSSVCHTPSTPVTIGIATIPATRAVRRPRSTLACAVSGSTWIAVSSTARRRNGEMTPSPAETTIRPQTSARRARYGPNSRMIRRRFALRTAGSAGRSGTSPVAKASKRRPGTRLSVPDVFAGCRGGYEADGATLSELVGQLAARRDRRRGARDDDRRPDHDLDPRAARNARTRSEDLRRADDRDRDDRRAGRQGEAGRASLPGTVGRPEHRSLREDRDRGAALERPGGARDRIQVAAPPLDGNAAERVEQPPGEAVAPELSLREKPQRSLERGAEEERIGERVVVRDHDRRARGNVLRADDVESPDRANRRCEDPTDSPVERQLPGQARIARAVSAARRA